MRTVKSFNACITLLTVLLLPLSTAVAAGLPHTFSAGTPANAEEVNANFRYVAPKNIVYVNPVDGGTAADNGAALMEAVDVANITAINGAPATDNPYLVRMAPGVYDTGSSRVVLPAYVSLDGAGQGVTRVESSAGIQLGNGSLLSDMSVVVGLSSTAWGVSATDVTARVERVAIEVNGGSGGLGASGGVLSVNGVSIAIRNGTSSSQRVCGVSTDGTSTKLTDLEIDIDGSFDTSACGVELFRSTGSVRGGTIHVNNSSAIGDVSGVLSYSNNTVLQDTRVSASGGAKHYPLFASGGEVMVQHSDLLSGTGSISDYFASINLGAVVKVATSRLGSNYYDLVSGSVTCAYVYDANFNEVACMATLI